MKIEEYRICKERQILVQVKNQAWNPSWVTGEVLAKDFLLGDLKSSSMSITSDAVDFLCDLWILEECKMYGPIDLTSLQVSENAIKAGDPFGVTILKQVDHINDDYSGRTIYLTLHSPKYIDLLKFLDDFHPGPGEMVDDWEIFGIGFPEDAYLVQLTISSNF